MPNIKELIAKNKLEEALSALSEVVPKDQENEVIQLQSRLSALKRKERLGVIGATQYSLELNKILYAILEIVPEEESATKVKDQSSPTQTRAVDQEEASRGIKVRKKMPRPANPIIEVPMVAGARSFVKFSKSKEQKIKILSSLFPTLL